MNPYFFLRGLWWPACLVLLGLSALMDRWHVLPFDRSWPLFVILFGLVRLGESIALTAWPPPAAGVPTAAAGASGGWGTAPAQQTMGNERS